MINELIGIIGLLLTLLVFVIKVTIEITKMKTQLFPNGGMLVFDPNGAMSAKQLASELKGVAKSPKYGLLDSAYFDTSAAGQGR